MTADGRGNLSVLEFFPRSFAGLVGHQPDKTMADEICLIAKVAELVDALDLGSSAARLEGSSPFFRTTQQQVAVSLRVTHPTGSKAAEGEACNGSGLNPGSEAAKLPDSAKLPPGYATT